MSLKLEKLQQRIQEISIVQTTDNKDRLLLKSGNSSTHTAIGEKGGEQTREV